MQSLKHQAGISYWGVMAIIMVAAIAVQFSVIAGPIYLDDMTLNKVIEDRLRAATNDINYANFAREVDGQLNLNGLRDVKAKDVLTVTTDNGLKVHKKYEIRKNFMSNIDIVVHFEKTFDQKELKVGK